MLTAIHRRAPLIAIALAFTFIVAVTVGPIGCGPVRAAVLTAAGAPAVTGCDAGVTACQGAVPVACSWDGRAWSATPTSAPCPWGCTVEPDGARCNAPPTRDASTDAGEVTP